MSSPRSSDAVPVAEIVAAVMRELARTRATEAGALLTPKQAAKWLACSLRTLYNLPIRRVKIGRLTRYDVRDLQLFADLNGTIDRLERAS